MDELGRRDSPVHRLDARAKTLVTLVFVAVVMSFPRHAIAALTPFLLYPVVLLSLGGIPLADIGRKLLLAAPFAVVVGLFNPLLDRQPVLSLGPWMVTGGWLSFLSILLRFVLTVGAALTLVACTGVYRLGAGLRQIGVPRVFVMQLLFLYRYLFVVAEDGGKLQRSVAVRSPTPRALSLRTYGSLVGHLLLRSLDRADRIHRAMLARGFDGEIRVLNVPSLRWSDGLFVAGCYLAFLAARRWDLAAALGRLVSGDLP